MTAPPAGQQPTTWEPPGLNALTRWQRDGLACVDCGRLLLFVTCVHADSLRDADDWTYEVFLCELCALRIASTTPPPTATEPPHEP
ncbi:hypothetical protein E1265_00895 [Streptomyces sp. 8K308]|uniref:hypothetical protein n=1 Tax=Streptomyces sp. 8K308 TaxID=2530388 RepID=UPI00104EC35E|nr:hypothetical protein [Streptomyces sp. 8K308]TDC27699.1 hypothetical protein E1265_00895 [Streptomyces sp. 8K308]